MISFKVARYSLPPTLAEKLITPCSTFKIIKKEILRIGDK
jgi:hypothetical protein